MSYTRMPRQPVIVNRVPQLSEGAQLELRRISNSPEFQNPYQAPVKKEEKVLIKKKTK